MTSTSTPIRLPPELSYSEAEPGDAPVLLSPTDGVSVEDYDRIARCMQINGVTWLEVAERGQQAGVVHWKVAGICRTLASYAAGGWQRKPSAKQARPALDAVQTARAAGILAEEVSAG